MALLNTIPAGRKPLIFMWKGLGQTLCEMEEEEEIISIIITIISAVSSPLASQLNRETPSFPLTNNHINLSPRVLPVTSQPCLICVCLKTQYLSVLSNMEGKWLGLDTWGQQESDVFIHLMKL